MRPAAKAMIATRAVPPEPSVSLEAPAPWRARGGSTRRACRFPASRRDVQRAGKNLGEVIRRDREDQIVRSRLRPGRGEPVGPVFGARGDRTGRRLDRDLRRR